MSFNIKSFDEFINEDLSIGVFGGIEDFLKPLFKNAKANHKLLKGMPELSSWRGTDATYPLDKTKKMRRLTPAIKDYYWRSSKKPLTVDGVECELFCLLTGTDEYGMTVVPDIYKDDELVLILESEEAIPRDSLKLLFEDRIISGSFKVADNAITKGSKYSKKTSTLTQQTIQFYSPTITVITYEIDVKDAVTISSTDIEKLQSFQDLIALPFVKYASTPIQIKNGTYVFELNKKYIMPFNIKTGRIFFSQPKHDFAVYSTGYVRNLSGSKAQLMKFKFNFATIDGWDDAFKRVAQEYDIDTLKKEGWFGHKSIFNRNDQMNILRTAAKTNFANATNVEAIPLSRIKEFLSDDLKFTKAESEEFEEYAKHRGLKWAYITPFIDEETETRNKPRIRMSGLKGL